jgi:hypothetical protein
MKAPGAAPSADQASPAQGAGSGRATSLAVFFSATALYVFGQVVSSQPPIRWDGHYTFLWARSLAFDFDLDLSNDYQLCGDAWRLGPPLGPGLLPRNPWGIGAALAWAPLLLLVRPFAPLLSADDLATRLACRGPLAEFALLGSALAAGAAVWLAYRLAARHVSRPAAALGAAAVALATPLPYYATVLPSFSHAVSPLPVALFLERWEATRTRAHRPARWVLLGILLGLAMLVRAQLALLAIVPAAELAAMAVRGLRARGLRGLGRPLLLGAAFAASALLVFLPQMLVWQATYRRPLVIPQGPRFMRWTEPNFEGALFSAVGGVFTWSPVLYLCLPGLVLALRARDRRPLGTALVAVLFLATYSNAAAWDFSGSGGFPNRRFTDMALPFAFALAMLAERLLRLAVARPAAWATASLGAAVAGFALWAQVVRLGGPYSGREQPAVDHLSKGAAALIEWTWYKVGNPLSWPASLPFALRYQVHPRHYDMMSGASAFLREPETLRPIVDTVVFSEPRIRWYLVDGFDPSPEAFEGIPAVRLRTGRGRMLMPLAYADFGSVELRLASLTDQPARVALSWNGRSLPPVDVHPGWDVYLIAPPPGAPKIGINELVWVVEGRGIALERMRFWDAPAEEPAPIGL